MPDIDLKSFSQLRNLLHIEYLPLIPGARGSGDQVPFMLYFPDLSTGQLPGQGPCTQQDIVDQPEGLGLSKRCHYQDQKKAEDGGP